MQSSNCISKNIKIVAVVQCAIALERCSGFNCSQAFYYRQDYFKSYPDNVMYVPFSCGGCPGRRISRLIANVKKEALKRGINKENIAVHLVSCVINDSGHYPQCPFVDYMKTLLERKGYKVIEGGYEYNGAAKGKLV